MKDIKKEMIEKSAEDFQKLNEDSKMFILGYMVGIQQERLKQSKHLFPAQNKQIFGYSLYLPLLAKITVARLYMKEQNTQKHILLDSLDSKKM